MRFLQRPSLSLLLLSGMVGLLIGLGSYTFIYRARRMNNLSLPVIFSVRPSSGSTLSFQRIRSASTRIKKPHEYWGKRSITPGRASLSLRSCRTFRRNANLLPLVACRGCEVPPPCLFSTRCFPGSVI
jgi:hypothetical protein